MNFNINSSSKRCQIRVREREKRFDEPQIDDGKQWNVGGFFMMIWVEVFNTKTNDCTIEIVNDQLGT